MDIKVEVNSIPWDASIEKLISEKLRPQVGTEALKKSIESGSISLYEVKHNGKRLGIIIIRIDILLDSKKELVIMHAVSEYDIESPLTSVLSPVFDEMARKMQVGSIRIHSQRRGIDKLLEESGYEFLESVFVKHGCLENKA